MSVSKRLFAFCLVLGCAPALAGPGIWTSSGPTGGDVQQLVVDPSQPGTLYALASNQVYKTTNTGLNWSALTIASHASSLTSLRMSPHDSSVLLVTSVDRLFRSDDAGASWVTVAGGLPVPGLIYDIRFDPHTAGVVWLSSGDSLYRSNDGGQSWAALASTGLPEWIYRFVADPHSPGRWLLLGADDGPGTRLFHSSDDGLSWTPASLAGDPFLSGSAFGERIAFTSTSGVVLFAANSQQMFRSNDGGATFVQLPEITMTQPLTIQAVTAHPTDPNTWWLGLNNGLVRTSNGGTTYVEVGAGIRPVAGGHSNGVLALVPAPGDPNTLYAGANYTGFFVSPDGGSTWLRRNQGLRQASVRALATHPQQPQWLYAGYGDAFITPSDGLFRSIDRGGSWFTASPTLEASGLRNLFIDPNTAANPFTTTMYAAGYGQPLFALDGTVRDGNAGVFKSVDGGTSWSTIDTGIPFQMATGPLGPYRQSLFTIARSILADPSSGGPPGGTGPLQTLYLSGSGRITYDPGTGVPTVQAARIYKSTDAGSTWFAADNGLPIPLYDLGTHFAHQVQAVPLVIDPSNPDVLYVGTFTTVPGTNGNIPEPLVSQGVVNGVFKSVDGGANWVHSSNGLPRLQPGEPDSPNRNVLALALAASEPSTLYVAVNRDLYDARIYKSTDAGATWFEASDGIAPDADIRVLLVDPNNADIAYAGSTGTEINPGGVYRTIDGGATWISYSIGLPSSAALALDLDTSGSVPRLYAGTRNGVFQIDQVPDEDGDGVPNSIEANAPNGGDGNGDGIPDTLQEHVASLLGAGDPGRGGDAYVTVELIPLAGTCARLENTHKLAANQFPPDPLHETVFGLIRLDIGDCQQAQLRLTYHGDTSGSDWSFRIFAPLTPSQPYSYAWRDFPASRDGKTWTVTVTDNALGDLRAADNAILFQGGIARSEQIFADDFEGL